MKQNKPQLLESVEMVSSHAVTSLIVVGMFAFFVLTGIVVIVIEYLA